MEYRTPATMPEGCIVALAERRHRQPSDGPAVSLFDGRRGFTLVEILISIGVLSFGMIAICVLFHLAVRNVFMARHRSIAAAVAHSAAASLRNCSVDLSSVPGNVAEITGASVVWSLDGRQASSLARILADYNNVPGQKIGHGHFFSTFQIPRDVDPLPEALDGTWNGATAYVACSWEPDYGWTATLEPTPIDDDGDGLTDEDPLDVLWPDNDDGDDDFNEDSPNVDRRTVWQAQIAVWRKYELLENTGPVSATFQQDNTRVTIAGAPADFWNRVKIGDWVRHRGYGIWYRIADVDQEDTRLTLAESFTHPCALTLSGLADFASRFRLIATYEAAIAP